MRAAIYSRVSTADQSAENQQAELRTYAAAQGWSVVEEYYDVESGTSADRHQFRAMLEGARRHRFDILLFWSLDRLTREGAARTLDILNRLHHWGVRFRSLAEEYLDSCGIFADAVIAILAAIAQQERHRISERTRAGLERARKQGARLGRPRHQVERAAIQAAIASSGSLRAAARQLHIGAATLRRRLRDYENKTTAAETAPIASAATSHGSAAPPSAGGATAGHVPGPAPCPNCARG